MSSLLEKYKKSALNDTAIRAYSALVPQIREVEETPSVWMIEMFVLVEAAPTSGKRHSDLR